MRVVYTHNYSAAGIRAQVAAGRYPVQHLYGAYAFERAGHELSTTDHRASRMLSRVSARGLRLRAGDLADEIGILRRRPRPDLVFAGEPLHVAGLARLRRRGMFAPALMAVFHQEAPRTRWWHAVVEGCDGIACLSERVRDQLVRDHGRDPATTRALPWGPDLSTDLYPQAEPGDVVVAAGKTGRDFATLAEALRKRPWPAQVWTTPDAIRDAPECMDVRVPATVPDDPGAALQFAWVHARDALARAAVVAIPLSATDRLVGLSELADALALGRPVIMTRSPFVDLDLDRLGCGRLVERGDVDGWVTALDELMSDAALRADMGGIARRFVEQCWNADRFGQGVLELAESLVAP